MFQSEKTFTWLFPPPANFALIQDFDDESYKFY